MISEESCDTEDWSNDAEDSALASQEYIYFFNILKIILKAFYALETPFKNNKNIYQHQQVFHILHHIIDSNAINKCIHTCMHTYINTLSL